MQEIAYILDGHCITRQVFSRNENPCRLSTFEGEGGAALSTLLGYQVVQYEIPDIIGHH